MDFCTQRREEIVVRGSYDLLWSAGIVPTLQVETTHDSEHAALGYARLFGDTAGDLALIPAICYGSFE